jgi:FkbM family methyltransferase
MAPAKQAAGLCYVAVPDESGRSTILLMDPIGGRDRIVNTIASKGWIEFERPLPAIFHACVAANGGLVIDVGANSGYYSLLTTCASTSARVLAFEPERVAFDILKRNIAANPSGDRIEVVELALSNRAGTAALYIPASIHDQLETSSSLESTFKAAHREVRTVRTTTLDDFLAAHSSGAEQVSVIKMDVEGHESAVIAGARRTIARWRPTLFVELLPRGDAAALTRLLSEENYIDLPLRGEGPLQSEPEVRAHADAWNHALVPAEAVDAFVQAADQGYTEAEATPVDLMSRLFDAAYYLRNNPDVAASGIDPLAHFMERGWREGRNPSAAFDTRLYIEIYRDVGEANINPLAHYIQFGCSEGRAVFAVPTA